MVENHGNVDTKDINIRLEVEKYPMHTEYKLEWRKYTEFTLAVSGLPAFYLCSVSISARHSTFIISAVNSLQPIPDLTIDNELCQDPHNMTAEDWTLLTMLYPQITTQYWNILKLLKDFVDKHSEEEYLIENVKCILKGE